MNRLYWAGILLAVVAVAALAGLFSQRPRAEGSTMPEAVAFRLLLGVGDSRATAWDGRLTVTGGKVVSIKGWRFAETDSTDYASSWKVSTRRAPAVRKAPGPMLENGVIVAAVLTRPDAQFAVETAQGNFSFVANQVLYGEPKPALEGRVRVERVPHTQQLTTSVEEQDHPALAQDGDDIWLVFVDFTHGDRAQAGERALEQEPKDFSFLARPAGGDQVKLMQFSRSRRTWSAAEDVSEAKQDCMRAAVAVDGRRRVWVIWSARVGGNFDLYAKVRAAGKWSSQMRLTADAGTDINPVAVTDSSGRVWVAWQAFRQGNLEVLAAAQDRDQFGPEARVSVSTASDWDPAIAASGAGEVAVSWDTHDKGDYDVYFRRLRFERGVRMEAPVPVAASRNFEARSAVTYDKKNQLWVAYEASDTKWGKDFGAYETTGIGLYQGHNLQVKCFEGTKPFATADDLTARLPGGRLDSRPRRARAQEGVSLQQPNPELAKRRAPSATPQPPPLGRNSFPRLAADGGGVVYLAYRNVTGVRSPIGSIWREQVVYFDGENWQGPVDVPNTDGLLDARPALLCPSAGTLLLVSTSDHRQSEARGGRRGDADGINSDLYAAELRIDTPPRPAKLTALEAQKPAPADAEVQAEIAQVNRMRSHRAEIGGARLRLLRGEFHRHTEISGDGGGDGPLIDAYRYLIDAAYMDWGGCCDHDNGGGREYYWWINQKLTDAYHLPGRYTAMFSYERSVRYPEGHRNTVFAQRGIRPLPRLPKVDDDAPPAPAPDTQMLYRFLRQFDGIVAVHTSGTNMGTDWRDNDPMVEPVVEIYQGDRQNYEIPDGPRSNNAGDSIGGWRPLGFVSLALEKGYRLGFQASSDHVSTHMSYCNLWVTEPTREGVLEAFKKRRIYGATENILADVRCGSHFMGEEFTVAEPPSIHVRLWGMDRFAKVHIIKDGQYVYTAEPNTATVDFTWKDAGALKGKTSYYYVRGEQADGELVWVSPMWITHR